MSYIVFARKWRPMTFEDVVGQDHVTETLKKAIEKDKVAHAYIFTGTRGVGKTTTARILARALNCEKGPTPSPCGTCESCKSIINGSSFDVIEIDGASNNSVDDIRNIRENIHYSSMGGRHRIYVIDEVHMLTKPAFNALLKTLEEPPPKVIFIFATTEPQKIPATIQSRCQRFDFRRISTSQIVERIAHICIEEHIAFDKQALTLVGRKAEGSMRDALSLLDQVHSYCHDAIGEESVRLALGLVAAEVYDSIMEAVKTKDPAPAIRAVEEILLHGYDLQEFIIGFEEYLRTLLFSSIPKALDNQEDGGTLESSHLEKARLFGFSERTLLRMTEVIRKAEQELKWSVFPRFSIELALLKLIYMDSSVSVEQLLEAFQKKRADALLPTGPASLPLPAAPMPIFPKQDPVAKKKIDLTVFSPGASADVAAPQTATGISLERQAREPSVSINDDIKREPIIKTVLDIFDGDLIR
jgi:DNA polymerase-3 subunit gamma/tau